jgi:hypothetical protein
VSQKTSISDKRSFSIKNRPASILEKQSLKNIRTVKIVGDKFFSEFMEKLSNNKRQSEIDIYYVQGAVKDTKNKMSNEYKGVGESMFVHFKAPMDDSSPEEASKLICYDIDIFADDLDLLKQRRFLEYAEKQCYKIALFMQKVRSMEILQM